MSDNYLFSITLSSTVHEHYTVMKSVDKLATTPCAPYIAICYVILRISKLILLALTCYYVILSPLHLGDETLKMPSQIISHIRFVGKIFIQVYFTNDGFPL